MFMVYWVQTHDEGCTPQCRAFDTEAMTAALQFTEVLRKQQREQGGIAHVTLSSENPHSAGLPGVADPAPDYNWKKRRA